MPVLVNIRDLATCNADSARHAPGLVADAVLAWDDAGRFLFAGRATDIPSDLLSAQTIDARGATVIPGLVDCHTHLAFAGWRPDEFAERCRGATYADIAARGGGILRTVRLTRQATEDELCDRARGFLDAMLRLGVTTVECKSGYGLT